MWNLIKREQQQNKKLKNFLASFSHDLKTSLASLRLQAESFQEDNELQQSPVLNRLVKDTVRLQMQLENSLHLANVDTSMLFIEDLNLEKIVSNIQHNWPEISIVLSQNCKLKADSGALESVFQNLIQNSVKHGKASKIYISPRAENLKTVVVDFEDDGKGFKGDPKYLGTAFYRHSHSSGSGIGLYITNQFMKRMNGKIEFFPKEKRYNRGFKASLTFKGELN